MIILSAVQIREALKQERLLLKIRGKRFKSWELRFIPGYSEERSKITLVIVHNDGFYSINLN